MDNLLTVLGVIFGIVLRVGIPLGATFLLGWFLRKLDSKWREEARQAAAQSVKIPEMVIPQKITCWEFQQCTEEKRAGCKAFGLPGDLPKLMFRVLAPRALTS